MTTYESKIESIKNSAEYAFGQLTDLRKLEAYKDRIPEDKLKDAVFTEDSVSVKINPIGNVTLRIIETEPFKTIKFAADNSPIAFNLWIQLKEITETDTRMKLTIKADIPLMLKPMIGNKAQQFIEQLAQGIATALNR